MLRAGPSSFNSMQQAVYSANRISSNSEAVPSYKAAFSLDIQQALDNYNGLVDYSYLCCDRYILFLYIQIYYPYTPIH